MFLTIFIFSNFLKSFATHEYVNDMKDHQYAFLNQFKPLDKTQSEFKT